MDRAASRRRGVSRSVKVDLVLAPNPGPMTGPGTNTWVVGSGEQCVVIDPGPEIPEHLVAVQRAVGDRTVVAVAVTHGHPDHAPGAPILAGLLGVPTAGPVSGGFRPDRVLADGDGVEFGSVRLVAVATPGHTPDSTCFSIGEALFTGDHIMGGSTVMVEDMTLYLESLRRVQRLRPAVIYPGHGPIVDDPARVIAEYLAHRLERESQILAAVRAGATTVGEVVGRVYAAVDPVLHPAAAISVEAHLRKLADEGLVRYSGGGWSGAVGAAP